MPPPVRLQESLAFLRPGTSRSHFRGPAAALYPTYRAWPALARSCGPVTIYARKTRIVFQAKVRFAGAVVRAGYIDAALGQFMHEAYEMAMKLPGSGRHAD